jgi:superfamily I DNA/RNA helicase
MVGFDIGPGLVKILKSFGSEGMPSVEVHKAINQWEIERLQKAKRKAATADRAECLRVFATAGPSLGAAIAYAESLFKSHGPIFLLSGHKAKGLEWESVYHLDPWRIPSQFAFSDADLEQEKNVEYVITTRSKDKLTHINMSELNA